jgi:hypothetical protein
MITSISNLCARFAAGWRSCPRRASQSFKPGLKPSFKPGLKRTYKLSQPPLQPLTKPFVRRPRAHAASHGKPARCVRQAFLKVAALCLKVWFRVWVGVWVRRLRSMRTRSPKRRKAGRRPGRVSDWRSNCSPHAPREGFVTRSVTTTFKLIYNCLFFFVDSDNSAGTFDTAIDCRNQRADHSIPRTHP